MSWILRAVIGSLVASVLTCMLDLPLARSQNLDINDQTTSAVGQNVVFSVNIQNAPTAIQSFGFNVSFDASILEFVSAASGTLITTLNLDASVIEVNNSDPGVLRAGGFTITPPPNVGVTSIPQGQSGELFRLTFRVQSLQTTTLSIVNPVDDLNNPAWVLGDGQLLIASGLSFIPLTPCRLFDTRQPTAGILTAGSIRIFAVQGTSGAPGNLSAQGGSATGCNVPDPSGGSVGAVIVNLAATGATGLGNIGIAAHDPGGGQPPDVSFLNFGVINGLNALANMVVIPVCTTGCAQGQDIDIQARVSNVHLIGDVVGYFGSTAGATLAAAQTPALECLASFAYQPVAPQTDFSVRSPACPGDETLTASFYEFLDDTGTPLVYTTDVEMHWPLPDPAGSKAMLCQGTNQSGLTVQVGCGANCCRTTRN